MWLHPQLSEGFLPSRAAQDEKNLYNKAVTAVDIHHHNFDSASSVNMNSEEQNSKYIEIVARQGNI